MSQSKTNDMPRRTFIISLSGLMAGTQFLRSGTVEKTDNKTKTLKDALSPEETKLIEKSIMAKDLQNYFGQDYSCAESMLMVGLRYLKLQENLVWAAGGFGGGMGQRDLCGFLTGGIMAIGLAAGNSGLIREKARKLCQKNTGIYWKWWQTMAPLHCRDIRQPGSSGGICRRLGSLAAAKVEELIKI